MIRAPRSATLLALLLTLPACHGSEGKSSFDRQHDQFLRETVTRIRDFQPPPIAAGWQAECLGRLAFAVPKGTEWAGEKPSHTDPHSQTSFLDGIKGTRRSRSAWEYTEILVSNPLTAADIAAYRKHNHADVAIQPRNLAIATELLDDAKKTLSTDPKSSYYLDKVKDAELNLEQVKSWRRLEPILGLQNEPDAYATDNGRGLITIRLLRNNRLYTFVRGNYGWRQGDPRLTKLLAEMKDVVARFHVRQPGELPTKPGICIPHGFVEDDGTADYETTATLRFPKHPSVTYTITTGLTHDPDVDGALNLPISAPLQALSYMAPTGEALRGHDVRPIHLGAADIGPYSTDTGGLSLNTADKGQPEVRSYQEFTGEDGYRGWQIWPLIHITMDSKTKAQAPSLPENPPPQKEAEATFRRFLSTFHFRKTQPPTDEFARRLKELQP